jgi:hypothetical protein
MKTHSNSLDMASIRHMEMMAARGRFDYVTEDEHGVWFWKKTSTGDICVGGIALPEEWRAKSDRPDSL